MYLGLVNMRLRSMRVQGRGRSYNISPPSLLFLCSLFLLPLLLFSVIPVASAGNSNVKSGDSGTGNAENDGSCFCRIDSGVLDDCPCTISTIDQFNKDTIFNKVYIYSTIDEFNKDTIFNKVYILVQ